MRVMLVNPRPLWDRLGPVERFSPAIPPLGIVWPATMLARQGHPVRVVDQHALKWSTDRLLAEVHAFRPDLVGFSCLTFAMDGVEDAVRGLRAARPDLPVVLGNLHASVFHRELVEQGLADFVVRGEAEETLPALVAALDRSASARGIPGVTWRQECRVHAEPDAAELDMASLPVPDWTLVAGARYEAFRLRAFDQGPLAAAVQASRGCAFRCRFCSQNLLYRSLRVRPVSSVVDEIRALHELYGVTTVGFVDANFPPNRRYGLEFASAMVAAGLHDKVRWFTELRVDLADEELIRECAGAGLALVQFGVESGDPDVLKGMNKGAGWSNALEPFAWCRKHGVLTVGLFVIGMPGESESQIERTVRLALDVDPDLAKFSVATPYPGSGLWFDYLDELKGVPWHKFSGWLDPRTGGEHLLEKHSLPARRLAALQRAAMRRFYLRPRKLARLFGRGLLRGRTLWDGLAATVQSLRHS